MRTSRKITLRAQEFLSSSDGKLVRAELQAMMESEGYNTASTYSPAAHEGNLTFIDKHMDYLSSHLNVDAAQYVSNLRLITKVKA